MKTLLPNAGEVGDAPSMAASVAAMGVPDAPEAEPTPLDGLPVPLPLPAERLPADPPAPPPLPEEAPPLAPIPVLAPAPTPAPVLPPAPALAPAPVLALEPALALEPDGLEPLRPEEPQLAVGMRRAPPTKSVTAVDCARESKLSFMGGSLLSMRYPAASERTKAPQRAR